MTNSCKVRATATARIKRARRVVSCHESSYLKTTARRIARRHARRMIRSGEVEAIGDILPPKSACLTELDIS